MQDRWCRPRFRPSIFFHSFNVVPAGAWFATTKGNGLYFVSLSWQFPFFHFLKRSSTILQNFVVCFLRVFMQMVNSLSSPDATTQYSNHWKWSECDQSWKSCSAGVNDWRYDNIPLNNIVSSQVPGHPAIPQIVVHRNQPAHPGMKFNHLFAICQSGLKLIVQQIWTCQLKFSFFSIFV